MVDSEENIHVDIRAERVSQKNFRPLNVKLRSNFDTPTTRGNTLQTII